MKKTLVAIAALAAFGAQAQSTVTITGTVDSGYQAVRTDTAGVLTKANTVTSGNSGTPGITFSGTEDLGGGMKAAFLYELNFNHSAAQAGLTNGTSATNGQNFVSLSGGFGDIKAGTVNAPDLTTAGSRQPFGTKIGGGLTGGELGTAIVRRNGSMAYTTPTFSGLTATVYVAPKANEVANGAGGSLGGNDAFENIGLNYGNGPLNASISSVKAANVEKNSIGANYTMGALTAYAGYGAEQALTNSAAGDKSKNWNVAAKYALNAKVNLLANYGSKEMTSGTNKNKTYDITAVGAQYLFSKRTNAYARYVKQDQEVGTKEITTVLVGLQHNF